MKKSNCLLFALKYRFKNPGSKIKAEWDDKLHWFHYYIIHNGFEIHCEQKNRKDKWTFLFEYKIRKIKLRKKNNHGDS